MNVVDSSGWIEYLLDTPRAALFADAIEDEAHLLVPSINGYEVYTHIARVASGAQASGAMALLARGRAVHWTAERAVQTADIAARHKLALADAMVYACVLEHQATLWTQDVDYFGLSRVNYFPKPGTTP